MHITIPRIQLNNAARAWADHVLKDCTAKEDAVAAGAKETWLSGWRVK